jgi:hypothetical protein
VPNSSGAEEEDQYRVARAYNNSIYLMAGMPYLLLGGVGFLVYRGLKQKARMEQAATARRDGQGDQSCLPSPDDASSSAPFKPGP